MLYFWAKGQSFLKETKLEFEKNQSITILIQIFILFLQMMGASFALFVVFYLIGLNDTQMVGETIRNGLGNPTVFGYLLVARAVSEEIFFRGFLSKKTGIIFSSILFGLAHFMYGSIAEVAGAIVLGLVLAWSFSKTNNLYVNIVAHFLFDVMAVLAIA